MTANTDIGDPRVEDTEDLAANTEYRPIPFVPDEIWVDANTVSTAEAEGGYIDEANLYPYMPANTHPEPTFFSGPQANVDYSNTLGGDLNSGANAVPKGCVSEEGHVSSNTEWVNFSVNATPDV